MTSCSELFRQLPFCQSPFSSISFFVNYLFRKSLFP